MTMIVYFPAYYSEFKCIADRCDHSCCVGWEITVDRDTIHKYRDLGREDILRHIRDEDISLCADGRCPFLDDDGLCRIISELGECYTSVICREHPRFYHRVGDRIEGGIGLSCEEAARIVLSSDLYLDFCEIEHDCNVAEETDFDALSYRDHLYSLLSDRSLSFKEKNEKIKDEYSVSVNIHSTDEWREILCSLEYLDENHRGIFEIGEGREEYRKIYERFLAYLVFRHVSIADNYENLRARLGFCLLACSILEGYTADCQRSFEEICDFVRIISEEIEYSEDNTSELIFEFEANIV